MRSVVLSLALLAAAAMPRPAEALVVLGWHDVRDRIADGNPDVGSISTRNLAMQFDWLRAHGYVPVTAQAVRDARAGRGALPDKAVLLTFDGGYRSVYTQAYPLLRAFNYPALVAVPTARLDLPAGATVREAGRTLSSSEFLGSADVKAMQASGLIEFASQGHDLVSPIAATPQGDLLPGTSRRWNGGYETEADLRERLRRDLATSADLIQRATGRRPQAVVWPAGAGGGVARSIAESLGMPLVLDAGARTGTGEVRFAGSTRLDDAMHPMRLVANENPGAGDLAYELRRDVRLDGMRAVYVALDDIVGADGATTSRNVDTLVERIRSIHPTHVFLQALSDTNGDGRADAAYFPGRLPVRSDLFAHVVARLASRAGVQTFAWLPAADSAAASADVIGDLALSAPISGLVFAGDIGGAEVSTEALEARARQWRPGLVTVRAIRANAGDGAAVANALPALATNHDFVAVMLPHDDRGSRGGVDRIVADVSRAPDGLDRAVFVIDATDGKRMLTAIELEAQARRVIASGGRHVAYTQDQPLKDQPPLDPARAAISARAFPYLER